MNKSYRIVQQGRLYKVEWNNGGEVSPQLKGLYTSHIEATEAINRYEKQSRVKPMRKVNNGKVEDTA